MELLQMKIFDLLLEPDLDFFRFPKHKTGWVWWCGGWVGKIPRPGYLHPHHLSPIIWQGK